MTTETWPRKNLSTDHVNIREAIETYHRLRERLADERAAAVVDRFGVVLVGSENLRAPGLETVQVLVQDLPADCAAVCRAFDLLALEEQEQEEAMHVRYLEERDRARSARRRPARGTWEDEE